MKRVSRFGSLLLALLLALSMAGCGNKAEKEQARFDAFMDEQFVQALEQDYTAMHILTQTPESFGVDRSQVTVGLGLRYDEESQEAALQTQKVAWEEFRGFDRELLRDDQKDTYDIYQYQMELSEKLCDETFDYYEPVFESMTGLHYQLPTMLSDWQLRNEQDVADLIVVVNDVKPYIDSALSYTKKQEEKGLLMVDLDAVIAYCDNILQKGENSAVLSSMNESIDALGLEAGKADEYKAQLKKAFTESFLPAYQNIRDTMQGFKDSGNNNTQGLAKFENGKAYYELLLQNSIGTDKSVEEVKTMMEGALAEHMQNMMSLAMQNQDLVLQLMQGGAFQTNYTSYDEMLLDIKERMKEDFPEVGNLDYEIKDVNKEIASDTGVAAYFYIPALDGKSIKQMRVNPNSAEISSVDTFKTVAHEGFPGHMYQYAYMYENMDCNYRKAMVNVDAYTEGYAVYAGYEGLKYLDEVQQPLLEIYKEDELGTYCLVVLSDIGIHYEGWSPEQFSEYWAEQGMALPEEARDVMYKQLQANPCAFESYYVGYQEFVAIKQAAEGKLGEAFDDKAFNQAILKSGTAPFFIVQRNVDAYVEGEKTE